MAVLDGGDSINRGLLGFWPMTENGGALLSDVSPYHRLSRIQGTIARGVSVRGRSVTFAGTSTNYGLMRSGRIVSGLPNWTIAVWARSSQSTVSFGRAIYCERASSGNDIVKIFSSASGYGNNKAVVGIRDTAGTLLLAPIGNTVFVDGLWHLLVVTKRGSAISLYQDGKLDNTATWTGTDTFTNSGTESRVASDTQDTTNSALAGDIFGLRLFSRALGPTEVWRLYADPWAGVLPSNARTRFVRTMGTVAYAADVSPLAYEYQAGAVDAAVGRTADVAPLAYNYQAGAVDVIRAITADVSPLSYQYTAGAVDAVYQPASTGDTHDGFLKRTRRQRAMDAAERQRRDAETTERNALRLSLEAAMGMAAEVVEDAPQDAAEAVEAAVAEAAVFVPALGPVAPAPPLEAAARALDNLQAAIESALRAKALADDDEDVELLLRAL